MSIDLTNARWRKDHSPILHEHMKAKWVLEDPKGDRIGVLYASEDPNTGKWYSGGVWPDHDSLPYRFWMSEDETGEWLRSLREDHKLTSVPKYRAVFRD